MSDLFSRIEGRAGRITLTRPKALNALTHEMCLLIEQALDEWRDDPKVDLILIDAEGEKAFCAGGDIAQLYSRAIKGEHEFGQDFWRDEYRMNAKIAKYPKPIVSFMQGFVMGGGVGVGGHASHRVIGETTNVAMPECGIGLIPDVGGSLILGRAPGHLGEYIGLTGARLSAGDALFTGFADYFIERAAWPALIETLSRTGDPSVINPGAPPAAALQTRQKEIDEVFGALDLGGVYGALPAQPDEFWTICANALGRGSPLSQACTLQIIRHSRRADEITAALAQEYRYTYRASAETDFLEGIRAALIDKDRTPKWRHESWRDVSASEVTHLLGDLGMDELQLNGREI